MIRLAILFLSLLASILLPAGSQAQVSGQFGGQYSAPAESPTELRTTVPLGSALGSAIGRPSGTAGGERLYFPQGQRTLLDDPAQGSNPIPPTTIQPNRNRSGNGSR